MSIIQLTDAGIKEIAQNHFARVVLCKQSFFHFLMYYLSEDFELTPASFHEDMINALDSVDDKDKYLAILGFRGSAKSTILEAFALWSMVNGKHNFIVYIRSTIDDAKMSLANIRDRIEQSDELQRDFNIILDDKKSSKFNEKWSENQITIGDCTAIARSKGQKVRGKKFKKARIDLIICDDLEDVKDSDTREKRETTRTWFFSEVLPATKQGVLGDNVKVVLLGNLVHRDCLIQHVSKNPAVKYLKFGIYKDDGSISWEGLYPNEEAIETEKRKVMMAGEGMGAVIWAREYLLKEVDADDMILKLSDIQYYPDEWLQKPKLSAGVGVDLAISQKKTADMTAMVPGVEVNNDQGERRLLIMKGSIAERLNFQQTIEKAVSINEEMPHGTKWYVEKVAYQQAAIEIMQKNGLTVVPMPALIEKRARAVSAMFYVKNGRVLFPRNGAEKLIENLVGFGIETHDDLTDACVDLILGMVKRTGGLLFA